MKNKPQLSELNLAVIRIESVRHLSVHKSTPADSNFESKTAIFRPALIQLLNTYIDLSHRHPAFRAGSKDENSLQRVENTARVNSRQIAEAIS